MFNSCHNMCIFISIDILVNSFMFHSSTVVVTAAAAGDGDQAQDSDDDHSQTDSRFHGK